MLQSKHSFAVLCLSVWKLVSCCPDWGIPGKDWPEVAVPETSKLASAGQLVRQRGTLADPIPMPLPSRTVAVRSTNQTTGPPKNQPSCL